MKGFDINDHFERKEGRKLDGFSHYALVVAEQAIVDSGINLETVNHDRVGVIWGSGIGGLKTFQDEVSAYAKGDGTPRFNPFFIPKMIADIASGHISIKYGFRGPNFTTVSACASSTNALIDRFRCEELSPLRTKVKPNAPQCSIVTGRHCVQALPRRGLNVVDLHWAKPALSAVQ